MTSVVPLPTPKPRTARLVLVTPDGTVVGSLPPVTVSTPWWQEAEPVVSAVREQHGIEVTILRLLAAQGERPHGGPVTYLAEVAQPVPAEPWHGTLDEHPLRHPYAQPGGPAADLAWALKVLAGHGMHPVGAPVQIRSWNLSSLWRIPVEGQQVWLKVVPPFFAHEGRLLTRLADQPVPRLFGHDGGRILLAEIPGEDLHEAELPVLLDMVTLLVGLQHAWLGRGDELLALGLPDWRAPALTAVITSVVDRTASALSSQDRSVLADFLADLPRRFAEVATCGLDDTLVHGDFHPGNVRGTPQAITLLDWGDSGVGHPLLDQPAFLSRVPGDALGTVRAHWLQQWRQAVPGSDPERAAALLAPVAAARQAVIYQHFLDHIEPAEWPYHVVDPVEWLQETAVLLRKEAKAGA
ncbi:aminoglycoside phosphotransferase family protein [Variovorax sp. GB1P17]|uniref:aminoglycoside phosphotransferase family protein n=1 Tax=Variovorax sp. GB1P17 TaxID=3443740 RepID=UPI003F48D9DE